MSLRRFLAVTLAASTLPVISVLAPAGPAAGRVPDDFFRVVEQPTVDGVVDSDGGLWVVEQPTVDGVAGSDGGLWVVEQPTVDGVAGSGYTTAEGDGPADPFGALDRFGTDAFVEAEAEFDLVDQTLADRSVPMFVVEAFRIEAIDESGVDWLGSDEIFAVWGNPGNIVITTEEFGDVDTGETRTFAADQRCIYPVDAPPFAAISGRSGESWGCVQGGGAAPIDLTVSLWEADSIIEEIIGGDFCAPRAQIGCEDDKVGDFDISWSEDALLHHLPTPGSRLTVTETVGGPCGYAPNGKVCAGIKGPWYEMKYRITRLEDRPDLPVMAP